jgi:hypothetical protein
MADRDETKAHSAPVQELLRAIPKVDEFLGWVEHLQAPVRFIKAAVREVLATEREIILGGRARRLEDLGREVLFAVMGDAAPDWFVRYRKQLDVNAVRRQLSETERAIEALQREASA